MGKKILIVDDSNLMRAIISNFIKKEGLDYEILTAESGEQSVDMYKSESPDLVFMDIKMGVMDGITALEKIREMDSKAKVVMCTSLKEPEQEQRAKAAGCVGYIMKPFRKQDIVDAINNNI